MARRSGLGRGLSALLDNNDDEQLSTPEQMFKQSIEETTLKPVLNKSTQGDIVLIPPDKLFANPVQPRKHFDETKLQELADSIKTVGLINPVIAADNKDGSYMIIAGERRTRAAKLAGLKEIACIVVKNYSDQKQMEVSLVENIQRTDLNPIEEAAAFKNLMDFSNLSQDELASRVGKNRSTVANALRLLKLSGEMQRSIESGDVSAGHARALLAVTDAKARDKLFKEIVSGKLSVREAEKRSGELNAGEGSTTAKNTKNKKKSSKGRAPELDAMEEKFISKLGTKVVIDGDLKKGKIIVEYYSMDDLDRLYEILG